MNRNRKLCSQVVVKPLPLFGFIVSVGRGAPTLIIKLKGKTVAVQEEEAYVAHVPQGPCLFTIATPTRVVFCSPSGVVGCDSGESCLRLKSHVYCLSPSTYGQ